MSGPRSATAILAVACIALAAMACGSSGPTGAPSVSPPPASVGSLPPDAALLVPDGDPVVGQLGAYVWREAGSDSPWLPGAPVSVVPTRSLRFAMSADVPVDGWTARYARTGDPFPGGPLALANGSATLEVDPPPSGTWTVVLHVRFGAGLGDAAYYWRVLVE